MNNSIGLSYKSTKKIIRKFTQLQTSRDFTEELRAELEAHASERITQATSRMITGNKHHPVIIIAQPYGETKVLGIRQGRLLKQHL